MYFNCYYLLFDDANVMLKTLPNKLKVMLYLYLNII
nr:MAG TPA: hypothetical protein [Caudoviricetes sp.]